MKKYASKQGSQLVKTANGYKFQISQDEWKRIGKEAGWLKTAFYAESSEPWIDKEGPFGLHTEENPYSGQEFTFTAELSNWVKMTERWLRGDQSRDPDIDFMNNPRYFAFKVDQTGNFLTLGEYDFLPEAKAKILELIQKNPVNAKPIHPRDKGWEENVDLTPPVRVELTVAANDYKIKDVRPI